MTVTNQTEEQQRKKTKTSEPGVHVRISAGS